MNFKIEQKNLRTGLLMSEHFFEANSLKELGEYLGNYFDSLDKSCFVYVFNDEDLTLVFEIKNKNQKEYHLKKYLNIPFKKEENIPLKYLILINSNGNQNKFYRLEEKDNKIEASYGRIGLESGVMGKQKVSYIPLMYYIKLHEKLSNGYVDQSDLVVNSKVIDLNEGNKRNGYKPHHDSDIERLLKMLYTCSAQVLDQEYTIQPVTVSDEMINKGENLINQLYHINDLKTFNDGLIELFGLLPRRMRKVRDNLACSKDDMSIVLKRESNLLDNMKLHMTLKHQVSPEKTINEVLGFEIEKGSVGDYEIVKEKLGRNLSSRLLNVYRVKNDKTNSKFERYQEKNHALTKMLWHGSRTENWLSIISSGLSLSPNAVITGKMFGYGIYFAPSAQKSYNYTSGYGTYWAGGNQATAFMGLFETAYGNPLEVYTYAGYGSLDSNSFKQRYPENNCLHAKSDAGMLRNDEIIFYDESQVNMVYLVELKA